MRGATTILLLCLLAAAGCSRAEDDAPASIETMWLETGTGPGQTVYPRAITYDERNDWLYLIDRMARVQRLDARTGEFISGWTMPDFRQGKPVGLSVGPDGNVYVADTHYHRVMVYTPDGVEVRRWGSMGPGPGQFVYPTDIAFSPDGSRVYVAEYGDNDRVQVFTPDGTFVSQFGSFGQGDGQFSRPQSMLVLGGLIYLTDACNHRLKIFTLDGAFVRNLGEVGDGPGQFRFPYGLSATADGNLLVTEFGNNRIQVVTPDGTPVRTWGSGGRAPGELAYPWAAVTDNRGRTVITDSGNNRLVVLAAGAMGDRPARAELTTP